MLKSEFTNCSSSEELGHYLSGEFDESQAGRIERHLQACEGCRAILNQLLSECGDGGTVVFQVPQDGTVAAARQRWISAAFAREFSAVGGGSSRENISECVSWVPELPSRYVPLRRLGRGGMGEVWEVFDSVLRRSVAFKFLRDAAAGLAETQRMLNEAAALGRLGHAGIVHIHEIFLDQSCPAIVMEYIRGGSLVEFLHNRKVSDRDAAFLLYRLCDGISHAHSQGVLHRDLKPSNVLLQPLVSEVQDFELPQSELRYFRPVLSDFGTARLAGAGALTQSGQLLGTPCYMSPEIATGKTGQATVAVDVFGVGAVMYELLTGRPPYLGETPAGTLALAQRCEIIRPGLLRNALSPDLENICMKCLEPSPNDRYVTIDAVRDDLRAFLENRPVAARRLPRALRLIRWGQRNPLLGGMTLILLLTLAFGAAETIYFSMQQAETNRQVALQLENAVDLIETLLNSFGTNPAVRESLAPDQLRGIYSDAIRVYGDYLRFHCPHGRFPKQHLLRAVRHTALKQMQDVNVEIREEIERLADSLQALTDDEATADHLLSAQIVLGHTHVRYLGMHGKRYEAAEQMSVQAEILTRRVNGVQNAIQSAERSSRLSETLRTAVGFLLTATSEFKKLGEWSRAAETAICGIRILKSVMASVSSNESDLLNYLALAEAAATASKAAGDDTQAVEIATEALTIHSQRPVANPQILQSMETHIRALRALTP